MGYTAPENVSQDNPSFHFIKKKNLWGGNKPQENNTKKSFTPWNRYQVSPVVVLVFVLAVSALFWKRYYTSISLKKRENRLEIRSIVIFH